MKFVTKEVDSTLQEKIIQEATTEWASTGFFAENQKDSLWLCIDYGKLDAVTIGKSHSLPKMDEIIDSLRTAGSFGPYAPAWNIG